MKNKLKIDYLSIVGLGYVGLPLALEFGKKYRTVGVDLSLDKIKSYKKKFDPAGEISKDIFNQSKKIIFTHKIEKISKSDIIIVAVPTPIDKKNNPDFRILKNATKQVGKYIKKNSIIVFESTVYPGATEEICIPILEKFSGLKWKKDFNVGYSPERVNPGDKKHTITNITKVVSADNNRTLDILEKLYSSIIKKGVFRANSIRVAEAAKVIENTQRDINIALMNELSSIFNKMNIDTSQVLKAANTKWNFLPFYPGLVGGHCIGVDPYYLTYKAEQIGYKPKLILSGRQVNDYMPMRIFKNLHAKLRKKKYKNIVFLGTTFKEDCSDIRNSKSIELINLLKKNKYNLQIHDPLASKNEIKKHFKIQIIPWSQLKKADALIVSVSHKYYKLKEENSILKIVKKNGIIFDVKSIFKKDLFQKNGIEVLSL